MKEAYWGALIIILGLIGVVVVNLFQEVTVDNDRVYYLIKESAEASAYDSVDLTYYRLNGDIKMVEDKFIENLTRRFAENVTIGNYTIVVQDINELPPMISLYVRSGVTSLRGSTYGIVNKVDAIIETKYKLEDVLDFLGITEEEWKNRVDIVKSDDGKYTCNNKLNDDIVCIPGDIKFDGWSDVYGLSNSYCSTDILPSDVERVANYSTCECGEWEKHTKTLTANPTGTGNTRTYTWTFNETGELRTLNETTSKLIRFDVCTNSINILTPKDKDLIKPENNPNEQDEYIICPSDGIRIPEGTIVTLKTKYNPANSTNRNLTWSVNDNSIISVAQSNPGVKCKLNNTYTNCISKGIVTAKTVGKGNTKIAVVTAKTTNGKTATCNITVWDGSVDSMKCEDLSLVKGNKKVINSSYEPKNASKTNFEFTSSDTKIATISGNTITGVKNGKVTITMKDVYTGKTTTCEAVVTTATYTNTSSSSSSSGSSSGNYYYVTDPSKNPPTTYYATRTDAIRAGLDCGANCNVNGYYNGSSYGVAEVKVSGSTTSVTDYSSNNTLTYNNVTKNAKLKDQEGNTLATGTRVKDLDKLVDPNKGTFTKDQVESASTKPSTTTGTGTGTGSSKPSYNPPASSSSSCFIAGTKVTTEDGLKNIEDIKVGDKVLSYNEVTKEVEYNRVIKTFIHDDNTEYIYKIKIGSEIIEATGNHPFYLNGKYVEAKELKVGDKLLSSNNEYEAIEEITYYSSDELVYNIEVLNNHNYYVGNIGYLVHNKGGCFVAGTQVTTEEGLKNIEDIKVGDKVLSYNILTKEAEYKTVTYTFIHDDNTEDIYELKIDNETILVTGNHLIYINRLKNLRFEMYSPNNSQKVYYDKYLLNNDTACLNRKDCWTRVKTLNVGDKLLSTNGYYYEITYINHYSSDSIVYNLEVEDNHNYFVGNNGYLVHNKLVTLTK